MISTQFNTCPVESKLTSDFAAQCSMFTYSGQQVDELLCTASCNSVYLSIGHIKVTCYIFRGEVYGADESMSVEKSVSRAFKPQSKAPVVSLRKKLYLIA